MILTLALLAIAVTVYAVIRGLDVRLALLLCAVTLASLAGQPLAILRRFLTTMVDEKYVVPICTAMGFAAVLRHTGCDQHLVRLLAQPLKRVRFLLIPGAVVIGFLVNIPVISQTSTAATIGTVLIPLLLAAGISPETTGAAILLGASVGGELFNPGAPELRTVVKVTAETAEALQRSDIHLDGAECVRYLRNLNVLQLLVATLTFWFLSKRWERKEAETQRRGLDDPDPEFRVNLLKALVPLVPLVLLFLSGPPRKLLDIPPAWLLNNPQNKEEMLAYDSRLIGAAMLVGTLVAALVSPRRAAGTATHFFEGAGYAFTHIISLIVTAACFGEGVRLVGLADSIGALIHAEPRLLFPLAALLPCAFAALSGSGMAATQSVYGFFALSALQLDIEPGRVGAVVSLSAAAGRTMSPVAAVTLMSATLTKTNPVALARRVVLPLLLGVLATLIGALLGL